MSKYTKEDIIRMVEEEGVDFIRMQFTDMFGQAKNVAITASQIEKAVNNQIMFDGSSIEGFARIDESDQYLYPDLDTFAILPWRPAAGQGGPPDLRRVQPRRHPLCGRSPGRCCKRVLKQAADMGYDASTSARSASSSCSRPTRRASPPPRPTTRRAISIWAPWTTARAPAGRSAWRWRRWALRSRPPITRCAAGQHEIDFKYADALDAADNIMTFKLAVKTLAQKQRPARHLHAQAHLSAWQRLRHAHQHVPVQGRQERVLRSRRRAKEPVQGWPITSSRACWPTSRA